MGVFVGAGLDAGAVGGAVVGGAEPVGGSVSGGSVIAGAPVGPGPSVATATAGRLGLAELPVVGSRRPLWDLKHPEDPDWQYE